MRTVLILGGSGFIGRNFAELLATQTEFRITFANRGSSRPLFPKHAHLEYERENLESCRRAFENSQWDHVVDFSGTNYRRVLNTSLTINAYHYSFLSSSAVDLALPDDPYLAMAQGKLWCESVVSNSFEAMHVRASFVLGKYDTTNRFEKCDLQWFWKNTNNIVRPSIEVEQLCGTMLACMQRRQTGIIRAGYSMS